MSLKLPKIKRVTNYIFEFFAILLGVFGAFYLEENQNDKERQQLIKEIMVEIKEELIDDLDDLKADASILRQGVVSNAKIRNYFDTDSMYSDQLCFDFYFIYTEEYAFPKKNGYLRFQSVSEVTDVPDSIMDDLSDIYETLYPRISSNNSIHPDMSTYFKDYYQQHFTINESEKLKYDMILDSDTVNFPVINDIDGYKVVRTIGYHPRNYDFIKSDPLFRMMLVESFEFRIYKYNRYRLLIQKIEEVVANLEAVYL